MVINAHWFALWVFVVAAAAPGIYALFPARDARGGIVCPGAKVVSNATISVGSGKFVEFSTFDCDFPPETAGALTRNATAKRTVSSNPTPLTSCPGPSDLDVCGGSCAMTCIPLGGISVPFTPLTAADCDAVAGAASVLSEITVQTFITEPGQLRQLTSGTCTFQFFNGSPLPMVNCWLTFAQTAQELFSICEIPTMSVGGDCDNTNDDWLISVLPAIVMSQD
ncbi:hypothetical protein C8Q77DRAFT_1089508 [Trametes polyzona]|nr:hypothetical protein C8Q77DRAFT_1089508 [Trametes polyzona]